MGYYSPDAREDSDPVGCQRSRSFAVVDCLKPERWKNLNLLCQSQYHFRCLLQDNGRPSLNHDLNPRFKSHSGGTVGGSLEPPMVAGFNWIKYATYSVSDYFIIRSEALMNLIQRQQPPVLVKVIDSKESLGDDRQSSLLN